jgi:hypothetical protein
MSRYHSHREHRNVPKFFHEIDREDQISTKGKEWHPKTQSVKPYNLTIVTTDVIYIISKELLQSIYI